MEIYEYGVQNRGGGIRKEQRRGAFKLDNKLRMKRKE
jgi:hypothetical protein